MTGKQEVMGMRDRVVQALRTRGVTLSLCDCGIDGRVWEVFGGLALTPAETDYIAIDTGGWSASRGRVPMVIMTCCGCGQARFYSAMFLGIVDSKGDLTPVPPDPSPASGKVEP